MSPTPDLHDSILSAWRTSNRVTIDLVEQLPSELWNAGIPGQPLRTIRTIAAHLHNSRCSWIKTLGLEHGIAVPARVDRRTVSRRQLAAALKRSSRGMEALLVLGFAVRAGYLEPNRALTQSVVKFAISGVVLAAVLWLAARFAAVQFSAMSGLRDEAALLLLVAVGAVVYGGSILALFGQRWLRSLIRA